MLQALEQRFPYSPWKFWKRSWWSRGFPAACGGPRAGAGEKVEEEGAAEKNCYGLTATPSAPHPLCHLELRGEEEKLGRKEGS